MAGEALSRVTLVASEETATKNQAEQAVVRPSLVGQLLIGEGKN